jgi:hypothetical protein
MSETITELLKEVIRRLESIEKKLDELPERIVKVMGFEPRREKDEEAN